MNNTTRTILTEVLAETDALLWPLRRQGDDPSQAQLAAQHVYFRKGLPYRKAGDGKTRMALLRELEASGLVIVTRENGRASHWKLTDHADEVTRALVGMPGRKECFTVMRRMVKLADAGDYLPATTSDGARFIRETDLGGFTYTDKSYLDAVYRQQAVLAYAWPRGWVTSALACGYGRSNSPMAHALTDAGKTALTMPATKTALPKRDAALADHYCNRTTDHGEAWESARHKERMTIYLQPYFVGWETVNELKTISAGTDASEKPEPTRRQPRQKATP
ncbi:MAG: hypothetical protein PCFJNLEI_03558 [Verrucomicrobiae bacterium]|nr:hypothetical protein [Verrucomicrobiae bacterium]